MEYYQKIGDEAGLNPKWERIYVDKEAVLRSRQKNDILDKTTKGGGERVQEFGRLNPKFGIENEFGTLNTDNVVLTDERIEHIKDHHPEDYELFSEFSAQTVRDPDIILKDPKNENTVFMVCKIKDTNLNTIIRLSIAGKDKPENKNSIMTFYRIREKNLIKLIAKSKTIYKKT